MEKPETFLKEPINVGDVLAYPVRQGSSMWINFGVVTGFGEYSGYFAKESLTRINIEVPSSRWVYVEDGDSYNISQMKQTHLEVISRTFQVSDVSKLEFGSPELQKMFMKRVYELRKN